MKGCYKHTCGFPTDFRNTNQNVFKVKCCLVKCGKFVVCEMRNLAYYFDFTIFN